MKIATILLAAGALILGGAVLCHTKRSGDIKGEASLSIIHSPEGDALSCLKVVSNGVQDSYSIKIQQGVTPNGSRFDVAFLEKHRASERLWSKRVFVFDGAMPLDIVTVKQITDEFIEVRANNSIRKYCPEDGTCIGK